MYRSINIFISHCGEDEKHIEPFKKLVGYKYSVRDSSIVESEPNNAQNEDYIKYKVLAPKINWAGTMVVLIGPGMRKSQFVEWEIAYAMKQGKRLIGVYLPGANYDDVPEEFKKYGDALVIWDANKICLAIDGKPEWENYDGTKRPNYVSITREVC